MDDSIVCEHVGFCRGHRTILEDVSFCLPQGEMLALIGHNGAGKSTLIKLLLGLIRPQSGRLSVLGAAPGANPLLVGYLPENVSFYDTMTVRDHLTYFSRLKRVAPARAQELARALDLNPVLGQRLGQCSKGQRQRLGLAQALLSSPKLLFLDEPTVGLDPSASAWMYAELSRLRDSGTTVVVCTHELTLIEPHMDRLLLIDSHRARAFGTLEDVRVLERLLTRIDVPADAIGRIRAVPALASVLSGTTLTTTEDALPDMVRRLTLEAQCFDFQVHKAGLPALFAACASRMDGGE